MPDREEPARGVQAQRGEAGPDRHRQGGLGQAIAGRDDVVDVELPLERRNGADPYGLGAAQRLLERGELDAARIGDVPHAVPVAEVRRHREGGAHAGDELQPDARVLEVRRQEIERRAGGGRGEGAADQPHVVIERQPGHHGVLAASWAASAMNSTVRHTLAWLSTTPRGCPVLPDVYWMKATSSSLMAGNTWSGRVGLEVGRLQDVPDIRRRRRGLVHAGPEPADGDHDPGFGVAEDIGGGFHAEGGIQRDGHGAEPEGAEEGVEELRAGREDEADLVAALDAEAPEPRRVALALAPELAVGNRRVEEGEVGLVGVGGGPLTHQLHESPGLDHGEPGDGPLDSRSGSGRLRKAALPESVTAR